MVLRTGGQFAAAEGKLRDALALAEAPTGDEEQAKTIKAWKPTLFSALGDALVLRENQEQAKTAYTAALNEGGPNLSPAARARLHAQLGSVALHQHLYEDATARFNDALGLFRSLGDRRSEATAWNQLGLVAMAQKRWAEAERCLRESLAIKEEQGDLVDAAGSYSNLAMVAQDSGRYSEAEGWHRRALAIPSLPAPERVVIQINFAGFLIEEVQAGRAARDRLAEAKQIAGEALRIDESLDASLNRVRLLGHLAIIADLEGRVDAAREYRSRERAAATKSEEIRRLVDGTFGKAISLVAALIVQPDENTTAQLDEMLQAFFKDPMTNVPGVIRRIANGERAWDELSEGLNRVEAVIVLRLLETISQLTDTLSPEQALASLPMSVRDALTQGDPTSLTAAVDALSPLERRAAASAVRAIRHSGEHFVERLEPYLRAAAEVALGDNARRGEVERTLLVGHDRRDFREAVRRIWSDERDPEALGQRLNQIDRQLVERILTIIGELEAGLAKLLEQAADMLETMARVALGRSSAREDFLASLPPTPGLENLHLVFRRVLTGERDPVSLTAGLPLPQIAIVRRLLALIEEKHAAAVATVDGVEMLIQEIGAVARGNDTGRAALEEVLADLAAKGSQLPALVRRIWDGERGIETLTKDLNRLDALFVVRLLKLIDPTHESPPASTEPTSAVAEPSNDRETILASLPEQVQDAYQRNDDAALQFALMFRAPQEKEAIWRSIESLRRKEDEAELAVVVDAAAPILQAIAEAALGIDARRSKVEELLPQMESQGIRIRDAVQRIWAGERSVADLTKGMTMTETALISHTLMFVEIEPVLLSIAAVAVGDATSLQSIEKALPGFEAKGLRISPTVRRIWAGERDAAALTEGLRKPSALVVGRILDYVSSIEAQFEPLLRLIARAALGDAASRTMVEEFLPKSTVTMELLDPVRRMWAGERNPDALTRGLTPFIASIVLRSLASVADASIKHEKTET
jgi:tetratricopeptide (TPR) repeat protein